MGLFQNLRGMHRGLLSQAQGTLRQVAERDQAGRSAAKFVRAMVQILILGAGAWLVIGGELSGGAMVAASILLGRALTPVEQLVGMLPVFAKARIALSDLNELASAGERAIGPDLPARPAKSAASTSRCRGRRGVHRV